MLPDIGGSLWHPAAGDRRLQAVARQLADAHYSRQSVGDAQYMPPGRRFVLVVDDLRGRAVWGVCQNRDPIGETRFRCSIFRNESDHLSSELIRDATQATYQRWAARGWLLGAPPLRTEVDPGKVKRKRDPGRCFLRAGWTLIGCTHGAAKGRSDLLVFEAPPPDHSLTRERPS